MRNLVLVALSTVLSGCLVEGQTVDVNYPEDDAGPSLEDSGAPIEDAGELDAQDAEGPVHIGDEKDAG